MLDDLERVKLGLAGRKINAAAARGNALKHLHRVGIELVFKIARNAEVFSVVFKQQARIFLADAEVFSERLHKRRTYEFIEQAVVGNGKTELLKRVFY